MKIIYLNNSAQAKPSEATVKAVLPYLREKFSEQIEVPLSIRELLGYEGDLHFAPSGKAAVHNALFSAYMEVTLKTGKNHFITSVDGEASTLYRLEKLGAHYKVCETDEQAFIESVTPRSVLASFSFADGVTGVIHSLSGISKICKERGILLHIDVTAALGRVYLDLEELQPDFVTFSSEPLHGPSGIAGLLVRRGFPVESAPIHQAALAGLGVACRELLDSMDLLCTETARLRNKLEAAFPGQALFCEKERLPHIACLSFPTLHQELLLFYLARKGIVAALGPTNTAISFSLSRETTEEEVDLTIAALHEVVQRATRMAVI